MKSIRCYQCHQVILGRPFYYYKNSYQRETEKEPFCSTLCIQSFKGSDRYLHYNIIEYHPKGENGGHLLT